MRDVYLEMYLNERMNLLLTPDHNLMHKMATLQNGGEKEKKKKRWLNNAARY